MYMTISFSELLEQEFLNWQSSQGKRKNLDEFAAYLGISRPLLSMWLSGKRRPGAENVGLLAELFGPTVYDTLGIDRPDPDLAMLQKLWPDLPESARRAIADQAFKYTVGIKNEPDRKTDPAPKTP